MNRPLKFLIILALAACLGPQAEAQLYVVYSNAGVVSEYDADSGALINETLILGLSDPHGICYADGALYIAQRGNGTIGKYDARTGRAIDPSLVTGLRMPQTVTVSDGVLYVGEFDNTQLGQVFGQIGKYNAVNGATMNPALIGHVPTPSGMAVAGDKLLVAYGGEVGPDGRPYVGVCAYNPVNGAMIDNHFVPWISNTQGLAVLGQDLWVVSGNNQPMGSIFKFSADTGAAGDALAMARPITRGLDYPSGIAVSGDDMYVTASHGIIGKYNAHTGEVINPRLIPPLGDRLGGIAVVPQASTGKYAVHDATFATKRVLSDFALVIWSSGSYVFIGIGAFVALVVVGLFAFFLRRSAPVPVLPMPETEVPSVEEVTPAITPAKRVVPPPYVPRASAPQPVQANVPAPYSPIRLIVIGVSILVVTVVLSSVAGYMVYMWGLSSRFAMMTNRDTSDLIGIWQHDNDDTRLISEEPFFHSVEIHRTYMNYSVGHGSIPLRGQWRDGKFWCDSPDGAGLVEAARLLDPENLQLHLSVFDHTKKEDEVFYKKQGSDAERQELAAQYPTPVVYPPPAGVIHPGMTEYQLEALPWKADSLTRTGEERYDQGLIYSYHSDDPKLAPLQVTVKNRRVVLVHGGND